MIFVEETDSRFYLNDSTLPNAGLGVFAKVGLREGDYLELVGIEIEADSNANRCTVFAHAYKFDSNRPGRHIIPLGFAGMVNHSKERQNMRLEQLPRKKTKNPNAGAAILRVVKPVKAGEELFHYYGDPLDQELRWKSQALTQDAGKEWENFLGLGLYGLDVLR